MTLNEQLAELFRQAIVRASGQHQPALVEEFRALAYTCVTNAMRTNVRTAVMWGFDRGVNSVDQYGVCDEIADEAWRAYPHQSDHTS